MAKSLNLINPNLGKFFAILNAKSKAPIKSPEYETGAIGFWLDPEHRLQTVQFRIERAETAPFSEDRFYSIAPFETDDHLMALEAFENLL